MKDLSAAEKAAFVGAILKMKDTPDPAGKAPSLWDSFVLTHREAFDCSLAWQEGPGQMLSPAHNSATFLPWHRQFQLRMEEALREVSGDPAITMPYWDFTDPASTQAMYSPDFLGGNGDPSQNYAVTDGAFAKGKWEIKVFDSENLGGAEGETGVRLVNPKKLGMSHVPPTLQDEPLIQTPYLQRNFGAMLHDSGSSDAVTASNLQLPTAADVDQLMTLPDYDVAPFEAGADITKSFRNALEGWSTGSTETCVDGSVAVNPPAGGHEVPTMHNLAHIWAAGLWTDGAGTHQGSVAFNTSPNDPAFYLLHANLDRLWAQWGEPNGNPYQAPANAPDGFTLTSKMAPFTTSSDKTIQELLTTQANGYTYEGLPGQ